MTNVMISGATSMLGMALTEECIARGTKVLAVIRKNSAKRGILPRHELLTVEERDLDAFASWTDAPAGSFDAFYHFAWEATGKDARDNPDAQAANIQRTLESVRLAARFGCKKFIGAGSQAEYGPSPGPIHPLTPVAPSTAYGVAKYAAGRLSANLAGQINLNFIWTRIFSVYGCWDAPSTMVMSLITALLNNKRPKLTNCEQLWDYLNCRDAARAFYLIGQNGSDQSLYNIGSGTSRKLLEYVSIIHNQINPALPLGIGEIESAQTTHLHADITNLTKDTGFTPTVTFDHGIAETIEFVQKNFGGSAPKPPQTFEKV